MNQMQEKKGGSYWAAFFMRRDESRMAGLDILRGVAILLVLFIHVNEVQKERAGSLGPAIRYLQLIGPTGVNLFFVLSGFLVGGLLLKELRERNEMDVRRFLIRRGFRIWPAYFVFLGYLFFRLTFRDGQSPGTTFTQLLPSLFHFQNYFGSPRTHTWSLAVEEHFYILLPAFLVLLTYRKRPSSISLRAIPAITIAVCVACAVARFFASRSGAHWYVPRYATHLRLDSLMFGVMLAYFYHFKPSRLEFARVHRRKLILLGAIAMLLMPVLVRFGFVPGLRSALVYMAYGAIVLAMVHPSPKADGTTGVSRNGFSRLLAFIGYFSYPIYLWHIDAGRMSGRLIYYLGSLGPEARWFLMLANYMTVTVVAGVLLGVLIDRPVLAFRDRYFPARAHLLKGGREGLLAS